MSPTSKRRPGARVQNQANRESMQKALERAVEHAQLAVSEAVASARALIDAASIGISGEPARAHPKLAEFARTLDQISDALSGKAPSLRATALSALLSAIDQEILRWEVRSRSDDDARAVLRAFMGLREILWELGIRPSDAQSKPGSSSAPGRTPRTASKRSRQSRDEVGHSRTKLTTESANGSPRVQRIKIEG